MVSLVAASIRQVMHMFLVLRCFVVHGMVVGVFLSVLSPVNPFPASVSQLVLP